MALIFLFSNEGSDASSGRSAAVIDIVTQLTGFDLPEIFVRKTAHFLLYLVFGVLIFCVLRTHGIRQTSKILVIGVLCVLAYAISDEVHQLYIGGRSAQVTDVALDTVAGFIGIGLLSIAVRRQKM
ncbi:hypothetical protein FACS189431_0360 [Alphaproteobacteria bacterium]|nr:hypothetical protein FACS189431_0360 [Alphaproteobacteria bacterium]